MSDRDAISLSSHPLQSQECTMNGECVGGGYSLCVYWKKWGREGKRGCFLCVCVYGGVSDREHYEYLWGGERGEGGYSSLRVCGVERERCSLTVNEWRDGSKMVFSMRVCVKWKGWGDRVERQRILSMWLCVWVWDERIMVFTLCIPEGGGGGELR